MENVKPVWLLDVDGVINVDRIGEWDTTFATGRAVADGESYRMRWVPEVVDFIRDTAEAGRVRVVWCTTWCPYTAVLEALWDLPKLDTAWSEGLYGRYARKAKRDTAKLYADHGVPVIWTDDDDVTDADLIPGGLAIQPDHRYGLTPGDLTKIRRFIEVHTLGT